MHEDYLGLLNIASVLIGNSSSGIIEAPMFHIPVINIGNRQKGRLKAENIIDCNYKKEEIINSIKKVIYDEEFKQKVKKCTNHFGDGKASERIAEILLKIEINDKLLNKNLSY